jgi:hypothetical protein
VIDRLTACGEDGQLLILDRGRDSSVCNYMEMSFGAHPFSFPMDLEVFSLGVRHLGI